MTATTFEVLESEHDSDRMRDLYEANAGMLRRTMLAWSDGDDQAAEDLVQETMLRAWRHLGELTGDPRSIRPWLLTVAKRLAIDALRARAARPREVGDDSLFQLPAAAEPYGQLLDRQVLREALATLPGSHRDVLIQIHFLQRSVRQVSEELGIPEGTVKSRAYNALRMLRKSLSERGLAELR
jgi:RNA polymerase sigma-70 factor (ECF subfamily)